MTSFHSTIHLDAAEKVGLERVAKEQGTSVNNIVRLAIRQFLGLSVSKRTDG